MTASGAAVEIRPYRNADLGRVVALWQACGLVRPWNPPEGDIAFVNRSGHGQIFVAAVGPSNDGDEAIIGSIMVGHDGHRGWVYYVAVDPQHQGSGLGSRLMQAAEAWLTARGVRKLELMIRETNAAVAAFYTALHYEREPVSVMSRWLDGTSRA